MRDGDSTTQVVKPNVPSNVLHKNSMGTVHGAGPRIIIAFFATRQKKTAQRRFHTTKEDYVGSAKVCIGSVRTRMTILHSGLGSRMKQGCISPRFWLRCFSLSWAAWSPGCVFVLDCAIWQSPEVSTDLVPCLHQAILIAANPCSIVEIMCSHGQEGRKAKTPCRTDWTLNATLLRTGILWEVCPIAHSGLAFAISQ